MSIRRERNSSKHDWKQPLVKELQCWQSGEIDRRTFLARVAAIFAVTTTLPVALSARQVSLDEKKKEKLKNIEWRDDPWWTLYEVQEHLFPHTDDVPGAKDIGATLYLKRELGNPGIPREEVDIIIKGTAWLNDLSEKKYLAKFVDLNISKREKILRDIEQSSAGSRWISLLIYYVIEALLSDPVYGGNPNGVGWKWLQHTPGFPRPTKNSMYSKLL